MIILNRILDHDLHRSKGDTKIPYMLEHPAKPWFFPAIISNSRGEFIVSSSIFDNGMVRVGVFDHAQDRIDDLINELFDAAYCLSIKENFGNVFNQPELAFSYIKDSSGFINQPHVCLIPFDFDVNKFGKKNLTQKSISIELEGDTKHDVSYRTFYRKTCRLIECNVKSPVFLSRPDFVGMYTQFLGGKSAILLHNVKLGIAFWDNA